MNILGLVYIRVKSKTHFKHVYHFVSINIFTTITKVSPLGKHRCLATVQTFIYSKEIDLQKVSKTNVINGRRLIANKSRGRFLACKKKTTTNAFIC